ncbi:uncharacterized protein LOC103859363 isoform X2 [Brassica rapa]|nr:uncharacterized protein LOC103859363 isoform X2 [Brassica rapa]
MKKHLTVLKEGEAVSINTFQLKDYLGEFRTNPYPYKITFFRTTKVKAADDFLEYYPEKYFSNFEEILSGKLDKNILVDVIGQIVNIGPMEQIKTKGKDNSKLDNILRDTIYISACEATWRTLAFPTHYRTTSVEKLSFHLPRQQLVVYNEDDPVEEVLTRISVGKSKFVAWMEANKIYPESKNLTYADFPSYFVWHLKPECGNQGGGVLQSEGSLMCHHL